MKRFFVAALATVLLAGCSENPTAPAPELKAPQLSVIGDMDGDGVADNVDVEPTLSNIYNYVSWTAANPGAGTATGTITLPGGHTVGVQMRVLQSNGNAGSFFAAVIAPSTGIVIGGGNYWAVPSSMAAYKSPYVLNGPTNATMIALSGGNTDSYVITFSEPVQDPVMDILSLGSGGNSAEYAFGREFELLSQGSGFWGGGVGSLTVLPGQRIRGYEGNGAVRFIGSISSLSWTVPDGEVFHNVTVAIRGLADPNADHDGDGVPDATDNCPKTSNADQADADFDGVGDACDNVNDPNVDTDGDGWSNSQEHGAGTSPTNPDTDGDGYKDSIDAFPLDPTRHVAEPPTLTPTVTGTEGNDGWYTSDVTVSWTSNTAINCPATVINTDTQEQTVSCTATNSANLSTSASVTIKRDATTPSVGFSGNAGSYTVDQTVSISCSASDAMSGIASSDCGSAGVNSPAYLLSLGNHSLSASATDNAGNTGSASASFTVGVTEGSVCALVQRWVTQAGVANSLCVKLKQKSSNAFSNEVKAQTGKFVPADKAAILIALAKALLG